MDARNTAGTSTLNSWLVRAVACAGIAAFGGCASHAPEMDWTTAVAAAEPTTAPATQPAVAAVPVDTDELPDDADASEDAPNLCARDALVDVAPATEPSASNTSAALRTAVASADDDVSVELAPEPVPSPAPQPVQQPAPAAAPARTLTSAVNETHVMVQSDALTPALPPELRAPVGDDVAFAAEAEFSAGHLAQTQNRMEDAARHFRRALDLSPRYAAAAYRLGFVSASLKRYDQAIETWWTYVRLTNQSAQAYANLGYCFELAGRISQAEAAYQRGIARDRGNKLCRVNYGLMLARLGREEESLAQLTVVLSPAEAEYNLASIYELQGRPDRALSEYRKALQIEPDMWQAQARIRAIENPRRNDGPTAPVSPPAVVGARD
jgi:Flp pilus assembly protein TadD